MSHMHHGHAHGHPHGSGGADDWGELAAAPVRRLLYGAVAAVALATVVALFVWWPRGESRIARDELGFANRVDAEVTSSEVGPCSYDPATDCRALTVEVTEGEAEGTSVPLEFSIEAQTPASRLEAGAKIVLDDAGSEIPDESRFSFADVQRGSSLWLLALVFAASVIVLGRMRGLLALVGIVASVGVLLLYVFPALLHGVWPLGVALAGSSVIAFITLYLAHGVNERTTVALLGTLASLLLTALLASVFAAGAHLSGLASEESATLLAFAPDLDFRGLLLAAVIIGALGVLDDVTITQVSAVWELHRTDPEATGRQLYTSGISIGRDHIASTVNTLVLAYSAAALPLLLQFTQSGLALGDVLATETVAVEIVQTLVGSIGLVASVPLTTALACWTVTRVHPVQDALLPSMPSMPPAPVPPPGPAPPRRPPVAPPEAAPPPMPGMPPLQRRREPPPMPGMPPPQRRREPPPPQRTPPPMPRRKPQEPPAPPPGYDDFFDRRR